MQVFLKMSATQKGMVKKSVSFNETINQVFIIPYEDRRNYDCYDVIRERERGCTALDEGTTIEVTRSTDNSIYKQHDQPINDLELTFNETSI